jgi:hypothetical protein
MYQCTSQKNSNNQIFFLWENPQNRRNQPKHKTYFKYQGAEENIWTEQRWSNGRLEEIA